MRKFVLDSSRRIKKTCASSSAKHSFSLFSICPCCCWIKIYCSTKLNVLLRGLTTFSWRDLRLEGARPLIQLTKRLRLRVNKTKILSTQKAKRVMVKEHGYMPQMWLNSQSYRQEMEVFGFPCQAISMLKLQKTLYGVLQRRKTNPHSPEKKTAVSFLSALCEGF
jgi:hypothetical protein